MAQVVGACVGAVVANLMFDLDAVTLSTHDARRASARGSARWWPPSASLTVILGVVRSARPSAAPFAVAGYIAAAYWFTSSTSFANPAVTVGRTLTDTFAGIRPSSAPGFVAAQVVGGSLAVALARYLFAVDRPTELVVPHEHDARP